MSNLLMNRQPAGNLAARIDRAQATAARLAAGPSQHTPSPGLRARVAAMPEELRSAALQLAREGYDACDALLQVYAEGFAQGQAAVLAERGLQPQGAAAVALSYSQANALRAKLGQGPKEMPLAIIAQLRERLSAR